MTTTSTTTQCLGGGLFLHADPTGHAVCPDCGKTVGGAVREGGLYVVLADHDTAPAVPATRRVTVSRTKLAQAGAAYSQQFLGVAVVHTTFEGEQLVGTLDRFEHGYPVAVFADGRWARLDLDLRVVVTDGAA